MTALQLLDIEQLDGLLAWYQKHQRDFPWRRNPEPYWVWLAEIMSQQTQMATLVPYFHRFVERFPSVRALARAEEHEVLSAWAGLGYYSRARNLHGAAREIVERFSGEFPRTLEDWLALPGVGPYTAAAIVSQCFGVEEPVWDGNLVRVTSRLMARADAYSTGFRSEMIEALRVLIRGRDASAFNQAFMELGATICKPQGQACNACPLQSGCIARQTKAVERFPPRKPRKAMVDVSCRVLLRLRPGGTGKGAREAFVQPRASEHWFAGLWDFPSELGGTGRPLAPFERKWEGVETLGEVRHQITHHRIKLLGQVLREKRKANRSRPAEKEAGRWIALDELLSDDPPVPLSTTAKKLLRLLMKRESDQLALY